MEEEKSFNPNIVASTVSRSAMTTDLSHGNVAVVLNAAVFTRVGG